MLNESSYLQGAGQNKADETSCSKLRNYSVDSR